MLERSAISARSGKQLIKQNKTKQSTEDRLSRRKSLVIFLFAKDSTDKIHYLSKVLGWQDFLLFLKV